MMKRILALILCLAIFAVIPACKPDNIQAPADIVTPEEQAALEKENESQKPTVTPLEKEEEPQEEIPEEKPEEPKVLSPLAAEDFEPSATIASTLPLSGMIKPSDTVSLLKNRTITFYTADDKAAFTYQDEDGKAINEIEWMKALAEENGFLLKVQVVPAARSVTTQRLALMAGKDLSLIQLDSSDLASGLTLCSSFKDLIQEEITSFGVSNTVLTQSDYKLMAPLGMVESIWYDSELFEEDQSPADLQEKDNWLMDGFRLLCESMVEKKVQPLSMQSALPFATLSGKSPITLKEGKLDTNINSIGSKKVWSALQEMNKEIPTLIKDEDLTYSLAKGTLAMEYTAHPVPSENQTLQFAPLPALEKEIGSAVTFSGTFFGLPKYEESESNRLAALTFAELWCNRYTEARAAELQSFGIKGESYQAYLQMAEEQGMLILYNSTIQEMVAPYLKGLTDESVNMSATYSGIIQKLYAYVATQNIYY